MIDLFTGIVEETGTVLSITGDGISACLSIRADKVLEGTKIGDSIAVSGVCLTVTKLGTDYFTADVMAETLRRTALGELRTGSPVNLERALAAGDRMGGHIVSGHIDGTGKILSIRKEANAVWYRIGADASILRLVVEKGSIAIDGISLTVASVEDDSFQVSVIPHTREVTSLSKKETGDTVNLENDVIGKYVERLLHFDRETPAENKKGITMEFLAEHGML